jgi:hypothetical protein
MWWRMAAGSSVLKILAAAVMGVRGSVVDLYPDPDLMGSLNPYQDPGGQK